MTATEEELKRGMEPVPSERVDRDGAITYFLQRVGDNRHLKPMIDKAVDDVIAELRPQDGEELWVCTSRFIGPFAGHKGLGIVRDGIVLRYSSIFQH